MKRKLSLLLAVIMILGSFSFAFAAEETAAETAGAFLKKVGILEGINGDLKLEDNLRRQDAVVLVARLHGAEDEAKAYSPEGLTFTDFKDPYYRPIIKWAVDEGLVEGHTAERFGFNEDITVQQYATILLRALGYNDEAKDYDKVMELAKKLELLNDVKAEAKDAVTRGEMAVMTFNALGTELKDEKKTLAEKLGIEMPAPDKLEVEKVETENLKEVIIRLSNAKLVKDQEKLVDTNNYKIAGNVVEKVTVENDDVVLLLRDGLVKNRKYEVVVRNVEKAIDGTHKFIAEDNSIPKIDKVEVLGEYGIKVTASEPIKNPQERNFLIDGKNVAMNVERYGRVLILTPYYDKPFPTNAEKLTIKPLEDYAGFKSIEEDFEIKIEKDEVAPEVVDVVLKGNVVEVTFDKDIYEDSVEGYANRNSTGNISYKDGRHAIYTVQYGADKVDVNKARYTFDREIPRRAEITIEGVTNHSDVKMERTTREGRVVVDYSEPVLIDNKKSDYVRGGEDNSGLTLKLYFDKEVSGKVLNSEENDAKELLFDPDYHFDVYLNDVLRGRKLPGKASDYIKSVKYDVDRTGIRRDVLVLEITGLNVNNPDKDYNYVLEVRDFTDITTFRNRMYRDYVDFDIPASRAGFAVQSAKMELGEVFTEIKLNFNYPVDRVLAENTANYQFKKGGKVIRDLGELGGEVIVENNGNTVTLVIPEFNYKNFETLEILPTLKDIWFGYRISGETEFVLVDLLGAGVNTKANAVTNKINELPKLEDLKLEDKEKVEKAREAYDALKDSEKAYVPAETLKKLVDAEAKIKELEEAAKIDKTALNEVLEAVEALNEEDYTEESWAVLAEALDLPETTQKEVDDKVAAINEAIEGLNKKEEEATYKIKFVEMLMGGGEFFVSEVVVPGKTPAKYKVVYLDLEGEEDESPVVAIGEAAAGYYKAGNEVTIFIYDENEDEIHKFENVVVTDAEWK